MELDYKKMYEDSLKMMQQMVLEGKVPKEIADMILPDVVEKSESDKMIDALVSGLIQYKGANGDYNFGGTDINEICNWLERQVIDYNAFSKDQLKYVKKYNELDRSTLIRLLVERDVAVNDVLTSIENIKDDKEPATFKYKIGDWIVYSDVTYQVLDIRDGNYYIGDTAYIPKKVEDSIHRWTIKDAKIGDVLSIDANTLCDNNTPFIYSGKLIDEMWPIAICGITTLDKFTISRRDNAWTYSITHPATKIEKNKLFNKMTNAGYRWDEEMKELVKLN